MIKLPILPFVYRWSEGLFPSCFNIYFKFISTVRSYSTRQSCDGYLQLMSPNRMFASLKFTLNYLEFLVLMFAALIRTVC